MAKQEAKTDTTTLPVPAKKGMKSTRDLVQSAMSLMDEALAGNNLDEVVKKSNVFNACATTIVKVTALQLTANEKREKNIPWLIADVSASGADVEELDSMIRNAKTESELLIAKIDDPATDAKDKPSLIRKSAQVSERLLELEQARANLK